MLTLFLKALTMDLTFYTAEYSDFSQISANVNIAELF